MNLPAKLSKIFSHSLLALIAVLFTGCLNQNFEKQSLAKYQSKNDYGSTFTGFELPKQEVAVRTPRATSRNSGTGGFTAPRGGFTFPSTGKFTFPEGRPSGAFTAPRGGFKGGFTAPDREGGIPRPANGFTWPNDPSEGPNPYTWPNDGPRGGAKRGGFTQPDSGFTSPKQERSGFSFPE